MSAVDQEDVMDGMIRFLYQGIVKVAPVQVRMNKLLALSGVEVTRIEKGKKEQNGYVEQKHWTDDEGLYIPYGEKITNDKTLFEVAYSWTNY